LKKHHSNGLCLNGLSSRIFFTLLDDSFPQKPKHEAIK